MKKGIVYSCLFLFCFILGAPLQAATCKNGAVYGTYINYGGSDIKEDGWSGTAYLNVGDCLNHNVELALTQTRINYKTQDDLDQTDITLAYTNTNQILNNNTLRVGVHYINTDDTLTDQGMVYFFKTLYYEPERWNMGIEMDYSNYDDSNTDLQVFQMVPHFGFYFSGMDRTFYSETRFYYIHKDENVGISQDNFYSLEQTLSFRCGNNDFKVSAWLGQQMFAVKNGGFVVYNLSDKYLGGIEGEVGYLLEGGLRLAVNLNHQWMTHVPQYDRATQTTLVLSLSRSF